MTVDYEVKEYYDKHGLNPVGGGFVFSCGIDDTINLKEIESLSDHEILEKNIDKQEEEIENSFADSIVIEEEIENTSVENPIE